MFYEPAELLFADVVMGSFASRDVFEALILNFQSFQMQNQQVLVALIPDLTLR